MNLNEIIKERVNNVKRPDVKFRLKSKKISEDIVALSNHDLFTIDSHEKNNEWSRLLLPFSLLMFFLLSWAAYSNVKNSIAMSSDVANKGFSSDLKVNPELESLKTELAELDGKIKDTRSRMWRLSLMANENANLAKRDSMRFHKSSPNYITLDKKWKLSDIPSTMIISQEEKNLLK